MRVEAYGEHLYVQQPHDEEAPLVGDDGAPIARQVEEVRRGPVAFLGQVNGAAAAAIGNLVELLRARVTADRAPQIVVTGLTAATFGGLGWGPAGAIGFGAGSAIVALSSLANNEPAASVHFLVQQASFTVGTVTSIARGDDFDMTAVWALGFQAVGANVCQAWLPQLVMDMEDDQAE